VSAHKPSINDHPLDVDNNSDANTDKLCPQTAFPCYLIGIIVMDLLERILTFISIFRTQYRGHTFERRALHCGALFLQKLKQTPVPNTSQEPATHEHTINCESMSQLA